jgi:hypothetical protein
MCWHVSFLLAKISCDTFNSFHYVRNSNVVYQLSSALFSSVRSHSDLVSAQLALARLSSLGSCSPCSPLLGLAQFSASFNFVQCDCFRSNGPPMMCVSTLVLCLRLLLNLAQFAPTRRISAGSTLCEPYLSGYLQIYIAETSPLSKPK